MRLKPWARSALWIGCGALVGLAVGGLLVSPARALGYGPFWFLAGAGFVFALLRFGREDADAPREAAPPPSTPRASPRQPTATGSLQMRFTLLDVPGGFPPVMGEGEPLQVRVRAMRGDAPAEGAAVRLSVAMRDGPRHLAGEGVTGMDGTVEFTVHPHGRGELVLEAEGRLDALTGTATTSVGIVAYEEEIERLFGEFRAYAATVLGPDAHSATARELAERLRVGATPEAARALLELARIYELVAYGEREADRRLYLALMSELLVLEQADLPESPSASKAPVEV